MLVLQPALGSLAGADRLHAQQEEPVVLPVDGEEIEGVLIDDEDADDATLFGGVTYDSSSIVDRRLDSSVWAAYADDERFAYDPEEEGANVGLIEEFLLWLSERLDFMEGPLRALSASSDVIVYILFALALFFVARALSKGGMVGIFRRSASEDLQIDEEFADIEKVDFPRLINAAAAAGDYRRAIRLEYLQLLRSLALAGLIDWRPEKTNAEYLDEIATLPVAPTMRELTLLFDYTWYGGFPVAAADYARHKTTFDRAKGLVGRRAEEAV